MKTILISLILLALLCETSLAQNSGEDTQFERVKKEVESRRKMREQLGSSRGIVVAPDVHSESWYAELRDYDLKEFPFELCCLAFANLARKEVMASSALKDRKISFFAEQVSAEKAVSMFQRALESKGIVIVPIGPRILVLVDAKDAPK